MADKIKRYKSKNYVTINNSIMKENGVSLKAKGLFALVMSLPDDWDFSLKGICTITKENYTAVNGAISELIKAGYCKRERLKVNGRFVGCDYQFFEVKNESPRLDFLNVENPHVENLNDNNNSSINTPLIDNKKGIEKKTSNEVPKTCSKSHEEQEYEDKMKERYPRIMKMEQPLTLEQAKKLKEKFDVDLIAKVMGEMENWKKLLKEKVSAYLTIINWCQREMDRV